MFCDAHINVENSGAASDVCVETDTFCSSGFFDEWKVQKHSIYMKYNLL